METINKNYSLDREDTEKLNNIWKELGIIRDTLSKLGDIKEVKNFISLYMVEEIEDLKLRFKNEFDKLPKDDKLKIEVLQTLAELGIVIPR